MCCVCVLHSYGKTAFWWETEELIRKLLLTAAVVGLLLWHGDGGCVCEPAGPLLTRLCCCRVFDAS